MLIKVSCDGTTEGDYFTNLQKFEEENLQSRIARIETRHLIDYQKWLESQKNIKRTTSTIKSLEDIKPKKRRNFRKGVEGNYVTRLSEY